MDRAKILDKIQKCLNLSKSSEPNEAAAALRQAQKMMDRHGITPEELGAIGYGSEKVSIPIQANQKLPIVLASLIVLIKDAFGVKPVIGTEVRVSDRSYTVTYYGPRDRVMLASYAHTVVHRAVEAAWRDHLKKQPYVKGQRGARAGFQLGWLESVSDKIEALAMSDEEIRGAELVIQNEGRQLAKVNANRQAVSVAAMGAGAAAAKDFSLHRPMSAEKLKITNGR